MAFSVVVIFERRLSHAEIPIRSRHWLLMGFRIRGDEPQTFADKAALTLARRRPRV